MNFREIEEADGSLRKSTVQSSLLGEADRRAGKECTGKLEALVGVLLARTPQDDPAAGPWRDRASWQRRWEALDDRGRSDVLEPGTGTGTGTGTRTGGALGWDGALEKLGMGADTEAAWLKDPRLSRIAAVIGELSALGLYRHAWGLASELLHCAEGMLGPQDPGMLAARHVAAYWTGEVGEVRTARDLTAALLSDCCAVLGGRHPLSRLAGLRLASWTTACGRQAEGRRLYRELVRGGPDDRITLLARLGGVRAALSVGEAEEGVDQVERLLPDLEAEYSEHHPVVLAARIHQAQGHRLVGRTAYSLELLEDLVADTAAHLGRTHPLTLSIRGRHANAVWANDQGAQRALDLAEEAYAEAVTVIGPDHPDTLFVGNALAITLAGHDAARSEEMFRQQYRQARAALGAEHELTLAIGHNLAAILHGKEPDAARPLYEEVRDAQTRVLGAEHPHTLLTRMNLAQLVRGLDGEDAARPLLEEVYRACVRVLGATHPDTLHAKARLRPAEQEPNQEPEAGPER
ncbi:tetratricopeptide repeat protein [Streptomyces sp. NPDC051366]|uniref:tetratricopeptide repeat protein n=1 Tax=Streptomyces sp. NPDC051366 TaxID=3365652 RepID=UPI0037A4890C